MNHHLIRQKRKSIGLTQAQLAMAIKVSQTAIAQIEAGRYKANTGAVIRAMTYLGLSQTDIISETEMIYQSILNNAKRLNVDEMRCIEQIIILLTRKR
jgi:predicted transcriptional regulator